MTKRWHASRLVWPHPPIFFVICHQFFAIFHLFYCYFSLKKAQISIFGSAPWRPTLSPTMSTIPQFFVIFHLFYCYFSPILLLFFTAKSRNFHIWKCTLEPNIVANNEHPHWAHRCTCLQAIDDTWGKYPRSGNSPDFDGIAHSHIETMTHIHFPIVLMGNECASF